MDKNNHGATATTDVNILEMFKTFIKALDSKYDQNKTHLPSLQTAIEELTTLGKEMIKTVETQLRQDWNEQQFTAEAQYSHKTRSEEKKETKPKGSSEGNVEVNKFEASDTSRTSKLEEDLRKSKEDVQAREREIEALMKRMPRYREVKTKQDQLVIEDTLSLNRQSIVEQDYRSFASDERIDACIIIQKVYNEKTDINAKRMTCMMFETVYEYVLATKGAMADAFREISKFVVETGPALGHHTFEEKLKKIDRPLHLIVPSCSSGSEYPRDVLDCLLVSIKESAPKIDTDIFIKGVKRELLRLLKVPSKERSSKQTLSLLDDLDDYLRDCIKLAWRMVTQVPPLRIEYQTFMFNSDYHKIIECSAEVRADKYGQQKVCYLWPGLVDGGGRIIRLGEVIPRQ